MSPIDAKKRKAAPAAENALSSASIHAEERAADSIYHFPPVDTEAPTTPPVPSSSGDTSPAAACSSGRERLSTSPAAPAADGASPRHLVSNPASSLCTSSSAAGAPHHPVVPTSSSSTTRISASDAAAPATSCAVTAGAAGAGAACAGAGAAVPAAPTAHVAADTTSSCASPAASPPVGASPAASVFVEALAAGTATTHADARRPPCLTTDRCSSLLDFLLLVGYLKKLKRTGWLRSGIQEHRTETVAEHSFRAAICAMLIGSDEQSAELIADGKLDKDKCVKMALVHDLAEALAGDITPYCRVTPAEKRRRESEALRKMCALLPTTMTVASYEGYCSVCGGNLSTCIASARSSSDKDSENGGISDTGICSCTCSRSGGGEKLPSCAVKSSQTAADIFTSQDIKSPHTGKEVSEGGCSTTRTPSRDAHGAENGTTLHNCATQSSSSSSSSGSSSGSGSGSGGSNSSLKSNSGSRSSRTREIRGAAAEILSLWEEYEAGETTEAKYVFDIDKFEMILQAYEYEEESYRNPTLLVSGKTHVRAPESPPADLTDAKAAQKVNTSCITSESSIHRQDREKQGDISYSQHAAPGQQQGATQVQQQTLKDGNLQGRALRRQQLEDSAQQLQGPSQVPSDQHPQGARGKTGDSSGHLKQRQGPLQASPMQQTESEATGDAQKGLCLSSFFEGTAGVFRSSLFQTLDSLLRERRRTLHCMHASEQVSGGSHCDNRRSTSHELSP